MVSSPSSSNNPHAAQSAVWVIGGRKAQLIGFGYWFACQKQNEGVPAMIAAR
jgi:hypothetical protein